MEFRRAYRTWGSEEETLIPEAQQVAFAELSARHESERSAHKATAIRGAYGQLLDPEARVPWRDLRDQQRIELVQLLGPALAEQHELRSSPEAHYVRSSMPEAKNEEQKHAQREAGALNDLATLAQAGGVELTNTEVRDLAAAIRRRGDQLSKEWGEPPANPTPSERADLEEKLKVELALQRQFT